MSRIDVLRGEKGTYKVLVNFVQRGISFHSMSLANNLAKEIKERERPAADRNLMEETETENA